MFADCRRVAARAGRHTMSPMKNTALAVLIVTLGLFASIHLGNADAVSAMAPASGQAKAAGSG
jgi:hypothetical protein